MEHHTRVLLGLAFALGCGVQATDVETFGGYTVTTTTTSGGYVSKIPNRAGGQDEIDWVAGAPGSVTYRFADGTSLGPLPLSAGPSDPSGAATGAVFLYAELEPAAMAQTNYTADDHAGCDVIDSVASWSCGAAFPVHGFGAKGVCCDAHDVCIARNCPPGQGSLLNLRNAANLALNFADPCLGCQLAVVSCMSNVGTWGQSKCCSQQPPANVPASRKAFTLSNLKGQNACGYPNQCVLGDSPTPEIDPCVCQAAGVPKTQDPCPGCLPHTSACAMAAAGSWTASLSCPGGAGVCSPNTATATISFTISDCVAEHGGPVQLALTMGGSSGTDQATFDPQTCLLTHPLVVPGCPNLSGSGVYDLLHASCSGYSAECPDDCALGGACTCGLKRQ